MTASNFQRALTLTLRYEGGYSDHPADPGGATNLGITRAVLSDWRGGPVTKDDVHKLSFTEAAAIYRRKYWDAVGGDELPSGIDIAAFDYAVNSGPGRASRALQAAVGETVDGIVGVETVTAARRRDPRKVIAAICRSRRGFLGSLRIFPIFGRGWLTRVAAIEAFALNCAAQAPKSIVPPPKENAPMNVTKSIVESRTVWANLIGLATLAASAFGFDAGFIDQSVVVDAVLKAVTGASFIASTIFRVTASKRLA